jgi:phospholipid/cholesterol/gamma-HCH transport system substrate-binding protein
VRWVSRFVSLIVVVGLVVGAGFLLRGRVGRHSIGQGFHTYALFRDASRIAIQSPVMIAGVRIGEVDDLVIVPGGLARVELRLRDDVVLPSETWATKKADSLFGDSYVELLPGGDGPIDLARGQLHDGDPIPHVIEGTSTDAVLRTIDRAMPRIDHALVATQEVMRDGRRWVDGPLQAKLGDVERWIADGNLSRPLAKADDAMGSLETWSGKVADATGDAVTDIPKKLDKFDAAIRKARDGMADARKAIAEKLGDARAGLDKVDQPVRDLRDVLDEVDHSRGEGRHGTLAKLINDGELGQDLDDLAEAGAEATYGLDRMRSWIGLRTELGVFSGTPHIVVTAELWARNDKALLLEATKDGLGGFPDASLLTSRGTVATRTEVISDQPRFTAQLGKRLGHLLLRGGIRESTPGVGADVIVSDDALRLSADVFGALDHLPRLRLTVAFKLFRWAYLYGGVDDALNPAGTLPIAPWPGGLSPVPIRFNDVHYGRDLVVGASLRFSDVDLATIVRIYGGLIAAVL